MPKDAIAAAAMPLFRPRLLIETAERGARLYRRGRDLPSAMPGLMAEGPGAILPRLASAERLCEAMRRERSPAYRPARHVQLLAALLAESAGQVKASGSEALRVAM